MATNKTTTTHTTSGGTHTEHEEFFRTSHSGLTGLVTGTDYETDYAPAYQYGLRLVEEKGGKYEDVVAHAKTGWEAARGKSKLSFEQAAPAIRAAYDRVIQLREEQLKVSKDTVSAGEVNLRKDVKTEHKSVTVPVEHEEVVIERRTVNKPVAVGDMDLKGETIRVPVSEEKVRVTKEAVVTEEVSVGKKKVAGQETVGADLKREELVVESDGKATVTHTDDSKKNKKS